MNDTRLNLTLWAAGLALTGVVLLLFNFDLLAFDVTVQYGAGVALALAAAGFFGGYMAKPANWWRLIPGWTLLALAGMAFLSMSPAIPPRLIAAVLFLGLGLAFANIYAVNRQDNWWAIIPGGFMLVVSVVTGLSASGTARNFRRCALCRHGAGLSGAVPCIAHTQPVVADDPGGGVDLVWPIRLLARR